jgi:uncharacterized protein YhbP (UPF0306 family)
VTFLEIQSAKTAQTVKGEQKYVGCLQILHSAGNMKDLVANAQEETNQYYYSNSSVVEVFFATDHVHRSTHWGGR